MKNNKQNQFGLLTLSEVFDNGQRLFKIPNYQRGYAWGQKQRSDLMNDIDELVTANHRHYTGTVVATYSCKKKTYELVDGQQRLTSLIILMSVLLSRQRTLNGESVDCLRGQYVCNNDNPDNPRYLLTAGRNSKAYLRKILSGENLSSPTNKSESNLKDAQSEFSNWLASKDSDELEGVFKAITCQLGFLMYSPEKTAEAGMMFEVINNRGKQLSQLEKIKNYLIYYAERHRKGQLKTAVKDWWPEILKNLNSSNILSNGDEERFLRYCWLAFESPVKKDSYAVYDNVKSKCKPNESTHAEWLIGFTRFLRNASESYVKLFVTPNEWLSAEQRQLQRLCYQRGIASIIPLVLVIFERVPGDSSLAQQQREVLFSLIEKLNFRFYLTDVATRNDSKQGSLFSYANVFYKRYGEKLNTGEECNVNWLERKLLEFILKNAPIEKVLSEFRYDKEEWGGYDFHKWKSIRYFYAAYEEYLGADKKQQNVLPIAELMTSPKKGKTNDSFHIEHIWASTDKKGVSTPEEYQWNKQRLGNFVLLPAGVNIAASNNSIEVKIKEHYKKPEAGRFMLHELKDLYESSKEAYLKSAIHNDGDTIRSAIINELFIDEREKKLFAFVKERWGIEADKEDK